MFLASVAVWLADGAAAFYGAAMTMIERVGETLWGPSWTSEMALALGINGRTVRRWRSGEADVPAGVWTDLVTVIGSREHRMAQLRLDVALEAARHAPQPQAGAGS